MVTGKSKIKVLLALFPLENHSRGIITVAGMLRDAGMEVVLIGNDLPERIIDTAIQEDVDVVGVSSLGGAHLSLGSMLIDRAVQEGIKGQVAFFMGGVFSPEDGEKMEELGFDGVFPPGSTRDEIVTAIRNAATGKNAS